MRHFFVSERPIPKKHVALSSADSRHLLQVLRAKSGMEIQVAYDGSLYRGRLVAIRCDAFVAVEEEIPMEGPLASVVLVQSVGKGQKLEAVIKHATECGVDAFLPLQAKRSVSDLTKKYESKRIRYEKIAQEAAKQSNRRHIPEILDLADMESFLACTKENDEILVCYEEERQQDILDVELRLQGDVYVVVGPEGGFDPEEIARLKEANAKFVSLGDTILRTETAGVIGGYIAARLVERRTR